MQQRPGYDNWQPRDSFDTFAGTSAGSILALYFARGVSKISNEGRMLLEAVFDNNLRLRAEPVPQDTITRLKDAWVARLIALGQQVPGWVGPGPGTVDDFGWAMQVFQEDRKYASVPNWPGNRASAAEV